MWSGQVCCSALNVTCVDLPTPAGLTEEAVQAVEAAVDRAFKRQKQSSVSLSKFGQEHWSHLSQAAGLTIHTRSTEDWVPDGVGVNAQPFIWDDQYEGAQSTRLA